MEKESDLKNLCGHSRALWSVLAIDLLKARVNRQVDKPVQLKTTLVAMNLPGVAFGLFIIVCGAITYFKAWGKEDGDPVFGRGNAPLSVKVARIWGEILVLIGAFLALVSTLLL